MSDSATAVKPLSYLTRMQRGGDFDLEKTPALTLPGMHATLRTAG